MTHVEHADKCSSALTPNILCCCKAEPMLLKDHKGLSVCLSAPGAVTSQLEGGPCDNTRLTHPVLGDSMSAVFGIAKSYFIHKIIILSKVI